MVQKVVMGGQNTFRRAENVQAGCDRIDDHAIDPTRRRPRLGALARPRPPRLAVGPLVRFAGLFFAALALGWIGFDLNFPRLGTARAT